MLDLITAPRTLMDLVVVSLSPCPTLATAALKD